VETQRTITKWGEQTFGTSSALEVAARMGMELVELLEVCASGTADEALHSLLGEQKRLAREINARVTALARRGDELACMDCSKAVEECADIDIMNQQVCDKLGGILGQAREAKMKVNRSRSWERLADGTAQHVMETTS